tara:strand:+ start:170 stop:793 length:624 start_codon:yes stop_codon:yes gene_type:complete
MQLFKNIKHYKVDQNTDEWLNLRCGKYTSSNFPKICANMGKAFGTPAIKYARKKALEQVTKTLDNSDKFSNSYMERGHELEPIAIELYERETFNKVDNGGFYCNEFLGDSPDGLVGSDGCVEVKSVISNTHWERIEKGGYDTSYKWQIQGHLLLSNRQWCDFISYCPEFIPRPLYVYRVERNTEMLEQLKTRLSEFHELVKSKTKLL